MPHLMSSLPQGSIPFVLELGSQVHDNVFDITRASSRLDVGEEAGEVGVLDVRCRPNLESWRIVMGAQFALRQRGEEDSNPINRVVRAQETKMVREREGRCIGYKKRFRV
ncbi:hypothetical protein ACJRO7_023565 [Eucalyptus globulus]|uniref:Uncharacterized protein n=1 Tax=Eucalyptus globulus TaxID=34317 RepID=A0ABD3K2B9_EUCGL